MDDERRPRAPAIALAALLASPVAPAADNGFTVDGDHHDLGRLAIIDQGDQYNPGVRQFNVYLVSRGVDVGQLGPSGQGDAIALKLHAGDGDLAPGRYTFARAIKPDAGQFNGFTVYTGYDFDAGSGASYAILDGHVDVSVTGDERTLEFDLKVSPATATTTTRVRGRYEGPVHSYHEP